jgi:non-ribosomal peptide synthetase component F
MYTKTCPAAPVPPLAAPPRSVGSAVRLPPLVLAERVRRAAVHALSPADHTRTGVVGRGVRWVDARLDCEGNQHGRSRILPRAAARFGDRPALVTSERTLSFRELDLLSDRVAVGLRQRAAWMLLNRRGPDTRQKNAVPGGGGK